MKNDPQTPQLLSLYYNIKDALVSGNASTASSKLNEKGLWLNADKAIRNPYYGSEMLT